VVVAKLEGMVDDAHKSLGIAFAPLVAPTELCIMEQ